MDTNPFAGAMEKAEALRQQFATLPESVVHGVVSASGAGGGKGGKEKLWSLNFQLVVWRPAGGTLRSLPLRVTKKVNDEDLKRLQRALRSETIVAISAKICEDSPFGDARAELVEVLAPPQDAELAAKLHEYTKPLEVHDPLFGTLVFNRTVDWFDGKARWLDQEVRLVLQPDDDNSIAAARQVAEALWQSQADWDGKARRFAADEMLENKNENWREEGEAELDTAQFMDKMRLNSITFGPDGGIDFWFDDGDMFWGHALLVCGTLADGFTDASIAG